MSTTAVTGLPAPVTADNARPPDEVAGWSTVNMTKPASGSIWRITAPFEMAGHNRSRRTAPGRFDVRPPTTSNHHVLPLRSCARSVGATPTMTMAWSARFVKPASVSSHLAISFDDHPPRSGSVVRPSFANNPTVVRPCAAGCSAATRRRATSTYSSSVS